MRKLYLLELLTRVKGETYSETFHNKLRSFGQKNFIWLCTKTTGARYYLISVTPDNLKELKESFSIDVKTFYDLYKYALRLPNYNPNAYIDPTTMYIAFSKLSEDYISVRQYLENKPDTELDLELEEIHC